MEQVTDYQEIKTTEDAFASLGVNYQEWLEARKGLPDDEIAYGELKHIVKALNIGQELDKGYYPWFHHKSSPSGFSYHDYDYDCARTHSLVGSRLLMLDIRRATYAGKQFLSVYSRYIN